jgi:hypothetical protein
VDPDIEAEVRGRGREIPGEVIMRSVAWRGSGGDTEIINELPIQVGAGPQDLMFRLSLATKRQELDARYVTITPEDWRRSEKMAATFTHQRPPLRELREVTPEVLRTMLNPRIPTFVEKDGAYAGNQEKKSPGG